ncbi:MAG: NAD(P)H-dependent oxidoreductase subunit E [Parachlamydiaceae bacterium]|nr:NAD(P)H-dependent oxidoreductase subunit E [Parachlamydiaceae bacterium]
MLSDKLKQDILRLQEQYPEKRSALIPALHLAQAEVGSLPDAVQREVAELFNIATTEVYAVVSFYDMFSEYPQGKHILHVCKNLSCMLRGSDQILEKLCHKLQVGPGGTTSDAEFTVIASECLAACDRAPMWLVDDQVVGPVTEEHIDKILDQAKNGPGHPSAMTGWEVGNG